MKNKKIVCIFIIIIIAIPIFLDFVIFGNNINSNLDNSTWASFFGGYLGGIATLIGVFITINDNNKKLQSQRMEEKKAEENQRKLDVKPYLETEIINFDYDVEFGHNDRVFDLEGSNVKEIRYGFTDADRNNIKNFGKGVSSYAGVNYFIRNIGAGSAVNMQIIINGHKERIAIAQNEKVNIYIICDMENLSGICINVELNYWDIESRAHYSKKDNFILYNNDYFLASDLNRGDAKEII